MVLVLVQVLLVNNQVLFWFESGYSHGCVGEGEQKGKGKKVEQKESSVVYGGLGDLDYILADPKSWW